MIVTTDIANIIYKACQPFGMPIYQSGNIPEGKIDARGRIVIHVKEQTVGKIWNNGFVEVNIFIADTPKGNADLIRLNEMERLALNMLRDYGNHDGTPYQYDFHSSHMLENRDLAAHYINVKILFKTLNTRT